VTLGTALYTNAASISTVLYITLFSIVTHITVPTELKSSWFCVVKIQCQNAFGRWVVNKLTMPTPEVAPAGGYTFEYNQSLTSLGSLD
jgi:hypothetical protein